MRLFGEKKRDVQWGEIVPYVLDVQPDTVPDRTMEDEQGTLIRVSRAGWSWVLRSPRGLDLGHADSYLEALSAGREAVARVRKERGE